MTDYHKDTGSSGDMMIRDTGSVIEFWLNSHNGSTFNHDLPWGYTINGVTNNSRQSDYSAGDGWVKFGSWTVSTDQTVTFRIFDTNTSGFGGPTTFSVAINRASAPNPPSQPVLSAITATSMNVVFSDGSNNGAAIDSRQIGYSSTAYVSDGTIVASDGSTVITGLVPKKAYNVWARTHNAKGYSGWSVARKATTIGVPDAPDQVITSDPTQTSFVASFTDNGNGGSAITARQLAYNTTNTPTGATIVAYNGVMTVTGLQPATTYYVWSRVQNAAGFSPWSPVATERTIAGTWFNVENVWKEAIPYVNDGGIWKLARPWGRDAGVWKESQ